MSKDKIDNEQGQPGEPVRTAVDFTDELSDEALDRGEGGEKLCVSCSWTCHR